MTNRQLCTTLQRKRKALGWSIRTAATKANMSPSTIQKLEDPAQEVVRSMLLTYVKVLGLNIEILER